jgi:ABC-type lipoprotein export system ATPase subunit
MHGERGSQWTKWDLHFHTPASYDYENKSLTNQEIVSSLVSAGIRVVAITDHHFIDIPRIKELQTLGAGKLTVLPGIELRSELGGSESVHFIGIFSELCDLEDIWLKLQGKLNISAKDIESNGGDDFVYVDLKDAARLIHNELDGIVSVHAGRKSNSIENISNAELFKMALKKDLVNGFIDIFEVGKDKDIKSYNDIVFPSIKRYLPLIICSDNHHATKYSTKASCWINADPCFLGLRHIIVEPLDRVYIGEIPDKVKIVAKNKTKYIKSVEVYKNPESNLDEIWFDTKITLNNGLIAIIGNKGSGKSALADIIGLLGNSTKLDWFPFLNSKQFCIPSGNKAKHFTGKLTWESGTEWEMGLADDTSLNQIERVKYIPQNFFEVICNELDKDESDFDKELKAVIFSHVDDAERLGYSSMNELLSYKTKETEEAIELLRNYIFNVNQEIYDIEMQLTPEYKLSLENKLGSKQDELRIHDSQKPVKVLKPSELGDDEKGTLSDIEELKIERQLIQEFQSELNDRDKKLAIQEAVVNKLIEKVENFERQYESFWVECEQYSAELEIDPKNILKLEINKNILNDKAEQITDERAAIAFLLEYGDENSVPNEIASIDNKLKALQIKLSESQEKYQLYEQELREWEMTRSEIVGNSDILETIKYYENAIQKLNELPQKLESCKCQRKQYVKDIYLYVERLAGLYRKLYEPVQSVIENHHLTKEKFSLNFDVSIQCSGFDLKFFEWVSHGSSGTFYGKEDGKKVLDGIVKKFDFNSIDDVEQFIVEIMDNLTQNKRINPIIPMRIDDQLRKGKDVKSFYDFLFSLEFLKPRYILKMGEKELAQLSPGEKGALLLIFYLLVDKADIPLLIDQPEHNLDNQTVYDVLVPCIKYAKQKRQIILVTHNPNLAVVCDADQVICASMDKKDKNRVTYLPGAIENPKINQKIVDILEGTRPAFDNRDSKYLSGNS